NACKSAGAMIGSSASESSNSAVCTRTCMRADRRWTVRSEYAYPASNVDWKKTRHVVQTAAEPPNHGRICFAMTGWTRNSKNALTKIVAAWRSMGSGPATEPAYDGRNRAFYGFGRAT